MKPGHESKVLPEAFHSSQVESIAIGKSDDDINNLLQLSSNDDKQTELNVLEISVYLFTSFKFHQQTLNFVATFH